ncbi:MAG: hypothetical protein KKA61_03145, partial [Nanoarchaeota archaeon]|nr:hypothetical protein [Nanoarchaeota archaeon]
FREIFSDYPARLGLVMGYVRRITDTLFPEIDKTFDGSSNPEVPAFYWIRQAHCFLSRYQEALYSSREKLNRKRKNKIQKLLSSIVDEDEKRISEFKSKLIEYCKKGEDLWGRLADEGLIEGNLEKAVLCYKNKEFYQEEKKEIENEVLNSPYLLFDNEEDSEGIDDSLKQFIGSWKKYYHPITNNYLELYQKLLPK